MNQQERQIVGENWLGLAQMYGKDLQPMTLKIMLDAVDDLEASSVVNALHEWTRTSKSSRHPLPAEIRTIVKPELSPDAVANEAASRIRAAIAKHGWANPTEAREYIGDLGWKIVERCGGWLYICENHGVELNPLTFHAQARDQAKAIIESAELGRFDRPIGIPAPKENRMLDLAKNTIKKLEEKK